MSTERFFAYARERQSILLRRRAGLPRAEWTSDPILQTYRFCNVFREDDTTTIWLRDHVREPMRSRPEVLLAVVLYRWFNRIQTGSAIFSEGWDERGHSAWSEFLAHESVSVLREAILTMCGKGPYVTGSYIIKTPDAMPKLDGVLWCIREFMKGDWRQRAETLLADGGTLQATWTWLRGQKFLGDFMAYEIVTDLRYTDLLCQAPDIMTWANAGPGAVRGLNRIHGRRVDSSIPKRQSCEEMQMLLTQSQSPYLWPRQQPDFPAWDMRTVEHTLCEFDKYERVRLGEGAPRQKFRSRT